MKLVIVLVVLGLFGVGGAAIFGVGPLASAEVRSCTRLARLCGGDRDASVKRCRGVFEEVRKMGGDAAVDKTATCLSNVQTCAAGAGCVIGGVGGTVLGEFAKGLQEVVR